MFGIPLFTLKQQQSIRIAVKTCNSSSIRAAAAANSSKQQGDLAKATAAPPEHPQLKSRSLYLISPMHLSEPSSVFCFFYFLWNLQGERVLFIMKKKLKKTTRGNC